MFDQGFGPDIRKFLAPLNNHASKPGDQGFQTLLVTATMTKAVQTLIDEEFEGIVHLRTSTFQKRGATARRDFIKLTSSENKLEAHLQVSPTPNISTVSNNFRFDSQLLYVKVRRCSESESPTKI